MSQCSGKGAPLTVAAALPEFGPRAVFKPQLCIFKGTMNTTNCNPCPTPSLSSSAPPQYATQPLQVARVSSTPPSLILIHQFQPISTAWRTVQSRMGRRI